MENRTIKLIDREKRTAAAIFFQRFDAGVFSAAYQTFVTCSVRIAFTAVFSLVVFGSCIAGIVAVIP